jgi:hypothetical protein
MASVADDGGLRLQAAQRGRPQVGVPRHHRPGEPRREVRAEKI